MKMILTPNENTRNIWHKTNTILGILFSNICHAQVAAMGSANLLHLTGVKTSTTKI